MSGINIEISLAELLDVHIEKAGGVRYYHEHSYEVIGNFYRRHSQFNEHQHGNRIMHILREKYPFSSQGI